MGALITQHSPTYFENINQMALPSNVVKFESNKVVVDHGWVEDDRVNLILDRAGKASRGQRVKAMLHAARELGRLSAEGLVGFSHALAVLNRLGTKNGLIDPADIWNGSEGESPIMFRIEQAAGRAFLEEAQKTNHAAIERELAWLRRATNGPSALAVDQALSEAAGRLCQTLVVNRHAEDVGDQSWGRPEVAPDLERAPSKSLPKLIGVAFSERVAVCTREPSSKAEKRERLKECKAKASLAIRARERDRATLEHDDKVVALPYPSPRSVRVDPTPAAASFKPTPFVLRDSSQIPMREWLYGTHLIRKEISATIAPGGVGKTALGICEALAMATGKPLLKVTVKAPLRVWLWNGEEPLEELERRITAACITHGIKASDLGDRLFYDTGNELSLVLAEETRDGTTILKPVIDKLVKALKAGRFDVMIVDPFVSTHNVTENNNNAIQKAASAWKDVAYRANVAISLAHHSRKLQGRDATVEDSRGADALIAKCRDARVLNSMSEAEAQKHGVESFDRGRYFWTGPGGKSNMAQRVNSKTWFRMESQALGNSGNRFDPGDSVGVVTAFEPPNSKAEIPSEAVDALGRIMKAGNWRSATNATNHPEWIGVAIAKAFDIDTSDAEWRKRCKPLLGWLERLGYLKRAEALDSRRHKVPVFVFVDVRAAGPASSRDDTEGS